VLKVIHELSESADKFDSGSDREVPTQDVLDVREPNFNLPVEAFQVGLIWQAG
jgi:hypothetical protein